MNKEHKGEKKVKQHSSVDLEALLKEHARDWGIAIDKYESDRTVAIIAMCVLDDLLKKLLKLTLIPHRKSEVLFKDEHLLQTTSAKINMAFFLGVIPTIFYEDLITMNRIRNIFAHSMMADITFENERVCSLLLKLKLGPRDMGEEKMPRWRFIIATQQLIDHLLFVLHRSEKFKLPTMTELHGWEKMNWQHGLTKEEIKKIEKRSEKHWYKALDMNSEYWHEGDVICIDPNAKLKESDVVAIKYKNEDIFGVVNVKDGKTYFKIKGKNITADDCEILGKIITKITHYD